MKQTKTMWWIYICKKVWYFSWC